MKSWIIKLIGTSIVATAIAFSLIQLRIPVARADSCPDPSSMGCNCVLGWSAWWIEDGVTHGQCHYYCEICPQWGQGGNNQFFLIEQDYVY